LIEGREYGLYFSAAIRQNRSPTDAGADAIGNVTLMIEPIVVPAPSSLACLVGVGVLVGLNEWRKKRRLSRRAKVTA
jgi:hypothetical protein